MAITSALAFDHLLAHQHFEGIALLQNLGKIHPPLEQVGNLLDMVGRNPRIASTDIETAVDHPIVALQLPLDLFIDHRGGIGIVAVDHQQRLLDVQADLELLQNVILTDLQLDRLARFEARQDVIIICIQHLIEGGGRKPKIVKDGRQIFTIANQIALPLKCCINRYVVRIRVILVG